MRNSSMVGNGGVHKDLRTSQVAEESELLLSIPSSAVSSLEFLLQKRCSASPSTW